MQQIELIEALPDALREALGQVVVGERRQWRRERELIEAQAQAVILQLRTEVVEMRTKFEAEVYQLKLEATRSVAERLALVRDGEPGEPGEKGARGEKGEKGEEGKQGPPGQDGAKGEKGEAGSAGPKGEIGFPGVVGERGEKGDPGLPGDKGPPGDKGDKGDVGLPGVVGARGEQGPPGLRGERGEIGIQGKEGKPGVTGLRGERGEKGERGEQGPQGKLPFIKVWETDTVYYAGDVVSANGSTWQARKDTGKAPPHGDWIALALRGIDGLIPHVRGTWQEGTKYRALDIVAFNKGSFIARHDDPGVCPGDGWQLLTSHGVRGDKGLPGARGDRGETGAKGERGERGENGSIIIKWDIDHKNFTAIPIMSDGSTGPVLELRELFEQFDDETSRR